MDVLGHIIIDVEKQEREKQRVNNPTIANHGITHLQSWQKRATKCLTLMICSNQPTPCPCSLAWSRGTSHTSHSKPNGVVKSDIAISLWHIKSQIKFDILLHKI